MEEFKRLNRELKYKGAIVDMYCDTIAVPNGNIAHWDFIHHNGAAAVVPVTEDGKILMVRQYRNALNRYTLEIPAGGLMTPDEPKIECASRELEEDEYVEVKAYSLDELCQMIFAGELRDGKTVASILAYRVKYGQ